MAITIGDIVSYIRASDEKLDGDFRKAEGKAQSFAGRLGGVMQTAVGFVVGNLITRGIDALGQLNRGILSSIGYASDLSETVSKVGVVFGDQAAAVLAFGENAAQALGMTKNEALAAAGTYGNLFRSMGMASETSANMSMNLVQLAADLASFNNIDPTVALDKLRAGLVGETEPLKALGVNLNQAAIEARAFQLGLWDGKGALDAAAKAQAAYSLIMEQTSLAQGDFARTSGGLANQMRILKATWGDLKATVGMALEPIATKVVGIFISIAGAVKTAAPLIMKELGEIARMVLPQGENIGASVAQGIANAIPYIVAALRTIRRVIAYWLQPGSPPRLLPELDKWGAGAARAYMSGWESIDTSVFDFLVDQVHDALYDAVAAGELSPDEFLTRMFGSRTAIAKALDELKKTGAISEETMAEVTDAAGPAGDAIRQLLTDMAKSGGQAEQMASILEEQRELIRLQKEQAQLEAALMPKASVGTGDEAAAKQAELAAQRAAEAQWQYQYSLADTTGRLEMMRQKLSETEEGSAEYWNTLQQVRQLEGQADAETAAQQQRLTEAQQQYNYATADTAGKLALMQAALDSTEQGTAEYYDTLLKVQQLQQQLADEQAAAQQKAQDEAQAAADAQWEYNYSQADTAGKLEMMRQKLAETTEGTADYWRTLQNVRDLENARAREEEEAAEEKRRNQQAAIEAEWQYRFALADTDEQLAMLREKLASQEEGSVEYYDTLLQIARLEKQRNEDTAGGISSVSAAFDGLTEQLSQQLVLPPPDTSQFESQLTAVLDPEAISAQADEIADTWMSKLVGDDETGPIARLKKGWDEIKGKAEEFKGVLVGIGVYLAGQAIVSGITAFMSLAGAISAAGGASAVLSGALAAIGGPITLIIAAIALLAAAWAGNWFGIRDTLTGVWNDHIKPALEAAWKFLSETLPDAVGALPAWFQEKWNDISTTLSTTWENIKSGATEKIGEIKDDVINKFNEIKDGIIGKIGDARDTLVTTWETIKSNTIGKAQDIKDDVITKFTNIKDDILDKIGAVRDGLKAKWDEILDKVKTTWDDIKEAVGTVVGDLWDKVIKQPLADLKQKWDDFWGGIRNKLSGFLDGISIKLPHISVSWQDLPVLGRIPTGVSVNWYGMGADFIADQAMLIGVGERGPERVQITPLSGAGAGNNELSLVINYIDQRQEPTSNLDRLEDLARGLEWRRRMQGARA